MSEVRVRIAPSPTGNLHVGTARIALCNYIYAKQKGGKFILRIEDTDLERSKETYIENIYAGLKALGMNWDEGPDKDGGFGPYIQSQRLPLYKDKAEELVEKGCAYYCFCTQEELGLEKEKAAKNKESYIYSGKCASLAEEQVQAYLSEGKKPTIRFKVPNKTIVLDDLIRKKVSFDTSLIGDFVILKSNGTPTYNFAVVVDDITMKISHIIRGEDHVSNTPKQILIYEAMEAHIPYFAHLSMILATDKTKLSKRHGATAVSEFIDQGYLPEAFVNFLALLGWSSPDGEEIKSLNELIKLFEMDRISPSPAIFDKEKLNWMNGVYIRSKPIKEITELSKKYLAEYDLNRYDEDKLELMVKAVREPLTTLSEIKDRVSYFFSDEINIPESVYTEALSNKTCYEVFDKFLNIVDNFHFDNIEKLEENFKTFRKNMKPLKPKEIMMPIRAVLTGELHGADLIAVMYILGKKKVRIRITNFINSK